MAKLTQAEVKAKADEIVRIDQKIAALEGKRTVELDPYLQQLAADTKEINEKYDGKVAKLKDQKSGLAVEVLSWLGQHGKAVVLEGDLAVATNEVVVGKRVIPPASFFEKVKERTTGFWDCVSIGIAKAEKLIGKTAVDEIAHKETTLVASVKAK